MLSSVALVSCSSSIDSPIILFSPIPYQSRLLERLYQYHLYQRKLSSIEALGYVSCLYLLYSVCWLLATLCAIKGGTALLAAPSVPRIAVFAAVANMAFVAYRARSDPIVLTIPDPANLDLLIAKRLFLYTIIMMLLNEL